MMEVYCVLCSHIIYSSPKITLITNAEVLDSLKEWNEDQMIRGSGEFGWMRSAVMRYLEMTPAGHLSQDKLVYSLFLMCRIKHFLSELKQFEDRCNIKFTPNEKMQMINVIPVQPVDVHIVVIVFYPYQ